MGPEHIAISPKPLKYQTNSPFDGQSAGWLLEASQLLQDAGLCRDLERNSRSAWTHRVYAGRGRITARYKLETPPARPPLSAWLPLVRLVWKWHIKQLRFIWVHNKRPGTGQVTARRWQGILGLAALTPAAALQSTLVIFLLWHLSRSRRIM